MVLLHLVLSILIVRVLKPKTRSQHHLPTMTSNALLTPPTSPSSSSSALFASAPGNLPSHSASGVSGGTVSEEHQQLASRLPPSLVLGSLPPQSFDIPFRTNNWAWTIPECNKHWGLDLHSLASVKSIKLSFGFCFWKELYIEFYHPHRDGATFFATGGIGGWTYKRDTTPSANVIATLPTASGYAFEPGTVVRIQCPFGGLISPMVSSEPVVGKHAVFYIDLNSTCKHPYMPVMSDGKTTQLKQPEFKPDLKVLYARLHGVMCVAAPLPGLIGIV
uniref:Uncharacterized protein n=1 Tax=Badge moss associated tymo-like virus TaxID=2933120 RepID=A0A9C7GX09_9VIRU|nr:hypothetical protein [Badge moss associated tymo-like virus]CAI5383854.1 hypothetical protein [Badge moss associated tymo-like virus]